MNECIFDHDTIFQGILRHRVSNLKRLMKTLRQIDLMALFHDYRGY
jgi:hypothetical protein